MRRITALLLVAIVAAIAALGAVAGATPFHPSAASWESKHAHPTAASWESRKPIVR